MSDGPRLGLAELQALERIKTTSLELAHIYADRPGLGDEQRKSLATAERHFASSKFVSACVMIDDYHPAPEDQILDVDQYLVSIEELGIPIAYYCLEADLAVYCAEILMERASGKQRQNQIRYADSRGRFSCSALTVAWYLLRLGYIEDEDEVIKGDFSQADELYTVLPRHFMRSEREATKLLDSIDPDLDKRITRIWFDVD